MRRLPFYLFLLGLLVLLGALAANATSPSSQASVHQPAHAAPAAPHRVVRINQLDPAQYVSSAEYREWALSACSPAALAEVFDSYGRHLRIHDVLVVQERLGEITPRLGLVEDAGIARTAQQFGFHTSWGYHLSLDQIIQQANSGVPVIVSWPPQRYPGGHLVVVTGGTSQMVFLADSSGYNRSSVSRTQFMHWWAGFSAIVTPLAKGGQP